MGEEFQITYTMSRYIRRNHIFLTKIGLVSGCFVLFLYFFGPTQKELLPVPQRVVKESPETIGNRTFKINTKRKQFEMDGKPFRYVSGSFHYFRALPQTWQRKLRTMRAAGLNAVSTYVEWSLHNPKENVYDFKGIANLVEFIRLAMKEDLYVILRPGPYICAERDMGGFPYWLLHKYPTIKLRSNDAKYLFEVRKWFQVLMPKIQAYLYGNGGPIIMVQIENEYGSFRKISEKYKFWLSQEIASYVEHKAVLFTADGHQQLNRGKISNILVTVNFPALAESVIDTIWSLVRDAYPKAPLVNSEFYPGWLTHWQENFSRQSTRLVIYALDKMLRDGANVNFYMFYGGTNFGFTAGANDGGPGKFNPDITSYDYDAPMDEAGDITEKYLAIRDVIRRYLPLPDIAVPIKTKKIKLKSIKMKPVSSLFERDFIKKLSSFKINSTKALSFEQLDQNSGFVLYETTLPVANYDPALFLVQKVRDRAHVFIDQKLVGVLSRENAINSLPIVLGSGKKIQILVENQGRINFHIPNDFKGLLGHVHFGGVHMENFVITGYSFDNYTKIEKLISSSLFGESQKIFSTDNGPVLLHSEFTLSESDIFDTYLDPTGWGKGFVFVNGFNIGKYWPLVGPQVTLYVPKELLKIGVNKITIVELELIPQSLLMDFSSAPILEKIQIKLNSYKN